MKNIKFPVYFATAYLFVYALLSQYEPTQFLAPWLFLFSPLVVIWMVIHVLKDGVESNKTFDESFYEDADMK